MEDGELATVTNVVQEVREGRGPAGGYIVQHGGEGWGAQPSNRICPWQLPMLCT